MAVVGMVDVALVAEVGDVQEVVLLGVEDGVMVVSRVDIMIMVNMMHHLHKVVVSLLSITQIAFCYSQKFI